VKLREADFSDDDISMLFPDKGSTRDFAHKRATKMPEGATVGAKKTPALMIFQVTGESYSDAKTNDVSDAAYDKVEDLSRRNDLSGTDIPSLPVRTPACSLLQECATLRWEKAPTFAQWQN